jgi:hypothetical protein
MFFRKRKIKDSPVTDKVAVKIAGGIISVQNKFSAGMNKLVWKVSLKKIKIAFVIFCLLSGGLSIYFFVTALAAPQNSIRIDKIKRPQYFDQTGNEGIEQDIYKNIQDYKKMMDSIGEPIRPSLLDSIKMLEEIYLQQQK